MELLLFAFLLGIIPGMIASSKGRSFFLWFIYGVLLFIIALVHAILVEDKSGKKCPSCSERIKEDAKVCKHCQHNFT